MANQPEVATYDAGVYQLEIADPVQGGVGGIANSPLLSLANRTGWLKNAVASLATSLGLTAPLNSPPFTGSPTVPTPLDGDISSLIPNTIFTNNLVRGISAVSVAGAGNITLTQAQWGRGILVLSGTLTGARSVIVPNTGRWIVANVTTGAFVLTVKTAAGAGVVVSQSAFQEVWADGATGVYPAFNDFAGIQALINTSTSGEAAIRAAADTAEAAARAAADALLTPLALFTGSNQSFGVNGYQKFPGGLILQWATYRITTLGQSFAFPITFPNSVMNVAFTVPDDGTASWATNKPIMVGGTTFSVSGVVINGLAWNGSAFVLSGGGGIDCSCIALGF